MTSWGCLISSSPTDLADLPPSLGLLLLDTGIVYDLGNPLHPPPPVLLPTTQRPKIQRIEVSVGDLVKITQASSHLRANYETTLPTNFNIGEEPCFKRPLVQPKLFEDIFGEVTADLSTGDRRVVLSMVAMSVR